MRNPVAHRFLVALTGIGLSLLASAAPSSAAEENDPNALWLTFPGKSPGAKKIVLISGDEEYRSEETVPMLAKILSQRHGFHCVALFAIDPETGAINPNNGKNIPGLQALDDAGLMIIGTRFRDLPDDQMKHIVDFVNAGKPIIGFRTATHAFNIDPKGDSSYKSWTWTSKEWEGGFGQQILGDTWVSHHGKHKSEATRAVVNEAQKDHPVLNGVDDIFGPTDVYGIQRLPDTATILLQGQVLAGMAPDSPPVEGEKNDPMMPLAWIKEYTAPSGKQGKAFCTTMGGSVDFLSADLRRLIVNAAIHLTGGDVPENADVTFVDPYRPSFYGFVKEEGFWQTRARKPSDYALGQNPDPFTPKGAPDWTPPAE